MPASTHCATQQLIAGAARVDLYAVGQILGHKALRMTQRYAHLSPDYMDASVGKLDGIMGGMLPAST